AARVGESYQCLASRRELEIPEQRRRQIYRRAERPAGRTEELGVGRRLRVVGEVLNYERDVTAIVHCYADGRTRPAIDGLKGSGGLSECDLGRRVRGILGGRGDVAAAALLAAIDRRAGCVVRRPRDDCLPNRTGSDEWPAEPRRPHRPERLQRTASHLRLHL